MTKSVFAGFAGACVLLALSAVCAQAAPVKYSFTGIGLYRAMSFTYDAPDLITADTGEIPAAALTACFIAGHACESIRFEPAGPGDSAHHPQLTVKSATFGASFYFPFDAFETLGTHEAVYDFAPGTLSVGEGAAAAVPEPALGGVVAVFGLLLVLLGRQRS